MVVRFDLFQGDCLDYMKSMPNENVDLVVTSPPYNLGINYNSYNDSMDWKEYYKWCDKWMTNIYRLLKPDGRFCLNHYFSVGTSNNRQTPLMELNNRATKKIGFKHHSVAFWTDATIKKNTAWGSWLSASSPYISSPYEGILFLYKKQWKKKEKGQSTISKKRFMKYTKGIWNIKPERKGLTIANFPLELPIACIELLSYKKNVVFDPFMGSGTTGVACLNLDRKFIGCEIDEKYFEIAKKRITEASQQTKLTGLGGF